MPRIQPLVEQFDSLHALADFSLFWVFLAAGGGFCLVIVGLGERGVIGVVLDCGCLSNHGALSTTHMSYHL